MFFLLGYFCQCKNSEIWDKYSGIRIWCLSLNLKFSGSGCWCTNAQNLRLFKHSFFTWIQDCKITFLYLFFLFLNRFLFLKRQECNSSKRRRFWMFFFSWRLWNTVRKVRCWLYTVHCTLYTPLVQYYTYKKEVFVKRNIDS